MGNVTVRERWQTWAGMRYRVWERPAPGSATPPLILIHGYAACAEQWARCIRDIGPDVPVYAIDLIGFGRSSKPRNAPYGRDFYVRQLEHCRAQYGWQSVVPVGHSFGGMIGIEWAGTHPDAAAAVIAIAPGGLFYGDEIGPRERRILEAFSRPGLTRLLYAAITHLPYRLLSAPAYADRAAMDPHTQIALRRALRAPGAAWSYSALFRHPDDFRVVTDASHIRCPLHIVWGTRDVQVTWDDVAFLRRRFPDATMTTLEGGGHCAHEERAREVAAEIRTLLVTDGLLNPVPAPLVLTE